MKHIRDACSKLHEYPEWWHELKAKRKREAGASENPGQAAFVSTEPQLFLIPQEDSPPAAANKSVALSNSGNNGWIVDSGATDNVTFDPQDFFESTQPKRMCIAIANGVTYPITRG